MKRCDQCKEEKPETAFLRVRRGWKVTKCNDCARANMSKYERGVVTDPDKIDQAPDA